MQGSILMLRGLKNYAAVVLAPDVRSGVAGVGPATPEIDTVHILDGDPCSKVPHMVLRNVVTYDCAGKGSGGGGVWTGGGGWPDARAVLHGGDGCAVDHQLWLGCSSGSRNPSFFNPRLFNPRRPEFRESCLPQRGPADPRFDVLHHGMGIVAFAQPCHMVRMDEPGRVRGSDRFQHGHVGAGSTEGAEQILFGPC